MLKVGKYYKNASGFSIFQVLAVRNFGEYQIKILNNNGKPYKDGQTGVWVTLSALYYKELTELEKELL